ncbi:MAG: 50S ribosomal protein L22 [gamma proteobacterium endosymbiont of Trioza apicalis]
MEVIAKYRYVCSSAQKVRLVINLIRNKKALKALEMLNFIKKKSSKLVKKVLMSAIFNAKNNNKLDVNNLRILRIFVDNGPTKKRIIPRAKGRSNIILKRSSHITVVLSDN